MLGILIIELLEAFDYPILQPEICAFKNKILKLTLLNNNELTVHALKLTYLLPYFIIFC